MGAQDGSDFTNGEPSSGLRFSCVVCTRNPRADYFQRVLAAIDEQSHAVEDREIVIVDSDSSPPLSERSFRWPRHTRFVRVSQPGIARARMAGAKAARGQWIVFVDDDNVLDHDYLQRAADVIDNRPDVALFCGRISGEFEAPPPSWLPRFFRQLAVIDFSRDSWASRWDPEKIPCWTAGMCVRRDVLRAHFDEVESDPFAVAIQTRVEDVYLVMRTVQKGLTAGLFRSLHLRHLIPPERMTPEYLCRITDETAYNMTVLRCRAAGPRGRDLIRPVKEWLLATWRHGWTPAGRIGRAAAFASFRGAWSCLGVRGPQAGSNA
jgi:cellulose synthase/poly-beta-1,6-N-acetylglucosamine synthase-like glycosyltransferase